MRCSRALLTAASFLLLCDISSPFPFSLLEPTIEEEEKPHAESLRSRSGGGGRGGSRPNVHGVDNVPPCVEGSETMSERDLIKAVMSKYNKDALPDRNGVTVYVELHIQDIPSISELRSDFEVDLLFSTIWYDPSLSFQQYPTCQKNITLDLAYLKQIWIPNACIVNSKSARIHHSPAENVALILYQNGTVFVNCRMRIVAPCEIDLRSFPFDRQVCHLIIESYSYHAQKVKLQWLPHQPITFMRSFELPDFVLAGWIPESLQLQYPNGLWDELKLTFIFKRRIGFFVLQAYIPTYMTMFVAWMSLFMDVKQISARATLGISAFLAMTLQFGNVMKNQPRVSYIKALDIWMLAGILFMFSTLVELAIVSYLQRSTTKKSSSPLWITPGDSLLQLDDVDAETQQQNNNNMDSIKFSTSALRHHQNSLPMLCPEHFDQSIIEPKKERTYSSIGSSSRGSHRCFKMFHDPATYDRISMILFPLSFLAFNLIYWGYFISLYTEDYPETLQRS